MKGKDEVLLDLHNARQTLSECERLVEESQGKQSKLQSRISEHQREIQILTDVERILSACDKDWNELHRLMRDAEKEVRRVLELELTKLAAFQKDAVRVSGV